MPGQHMAVGRTLIEPIAGPTALDVQVEVTAWVRPAHGEGGLVAEGVLTEPEGAGGSVTRFSVRSTWPALEEVVDVTAVYRAADGRILGAASTTVPQIAPDKSVAVRLRLLPPHPHPPPPEGFVAPGFRAPTPGG